MQVTVTAAVLADLLFDEFDGKDQNPFRPREVREQRPRGEKTATGFGRHAILLRR